MISSTSANRLRNSRKRAPRDSPVEPFRERFAQQADDQHGLGRAHRRDQRQQEEHHMNTATVALFIAAAIDAFLFSFALSRIKHRRFIERRCANR